MKWWYEGSASRGLYFSVQSPRIVKGKTHLVPILISYQYTESIYRTMTEGFFDEKLISNHCLNIRRLVGGSISTASSSKAYWPPWWHHLFITYLYRCQLALRLIVMDTYSTIWIATPTSTQPLPHLSFSSAPLHLPQRSLPSASCH